MNNEILYQLINFDEYSITPKYLQLAHCIVKNIEIGKIKKDYILPSINDFSFEFNISRNTIEKTYRHLKQLGIVSSVPGKGYFISKTDFKQTIKVLLLFNKLSTHKKIIYDSFAATLNEQAAIDFYIYNNDFNLFKKILQNRKSGYTHYVIIPHFLEGGEKANEIINELSEGKLILMDKLIDGMSIEYGAVYENFEKDIFEALKQMLPKLKKYKKIKIVFPSYSYFPKEILKGYEAFCIQYQYNYSTVNNIENDTLNDGDVYIILMEDDLVTLLTKIKSTKLKVGKNIGIISYNETPLKQFILDGITTVSTDFVKMGELTAQRILNDDKQQVEVPFTLTLRNSL